MNLTDPPPGLLADVDENDHQRITAAFHLAARAHHGQLRRSGDPYLTHPVSVAELLHQWGMDTPTICAGLLHDVVEDTPTTLDDIRNTLGRDTFAETTATIVEGLTKIDGLKLVRHSDDDHDREHLQALLLSLVSDIRIVVAKLADRLHNVRTLEHLPAPKARRIARETLDVYAPLAHRFGLNEVAYELEDRSFAILLPDHHQALHAMVQDRIARAGGDLDTLPDTLATILRDAHIEADVTMRTKQLWSLFEKLQRRQLDFDAVLDVIGFRIIVDSDAECYLALGVVHRHLRPIPGRIKDYIAAPKANLYQSLHTTVTTTSGAPVEIQIRSRDMHHRSEWGFAAHWRYKTVPDHLLLDRVDTHLGSLRRQPDITLRIKRGDIVCYTPTGDPVTLPKGSCVLDFAYAVHTDLGDLCVGAKVNNHLSSVTTTLEDGDHVDIIAGPSASQHLDHLAAVQTGKARNRIRHLARQHQHTTVVELGRNLLLEAFRNAGVPARLVDDPQLSAIARRHGFATVDALLRHISEGRVDPLAVVTSTLSHTTLPTVDGAVAVPGWDVALRVPSDVSRLRLGRCCFPVPGDRIATVREPLNRRHRRRDVGLTVHRVECPNVHRRDITEASWIDTPGEAPCCFVVHALDRAGIVQDLTAVVYDNGSRFVVNHTNHTPTRELVFLLELAVTSYEVAELLVHQIRDILGVVTCERYLGAVPPL